MAVCGSKERQTWPQGRSAGSWAADAPSVCIAAAVPSSPQLSSLHALGPTTRHVAAVKMINPSYHLFSGQQNQTDQFVLSYVNHQLGFQEHF